MSNINLNPNPISEQIETSPSMESNLPLSITLISWFNIIYGLIIFILGGFISSGIGSLNEPINSVLRVLIVSIYGVAGMIFFVGTWALFIFGIIIVFLGYMLLQRNRAVWFIFFLGSLLSLLGVIQTINLLFQNLSFGNELTAGAIIAPLYYIFLVWKLWEHRKVFGV